MRNLLLLPVVVLMTACAIGPGNGLPPVQDVEPSPVVLTPQPFPEPFVLKEMPRRGDSHTVPFRVEDIRWSQQVGSNTISGKAHAPLISGQIATCAGGYGYAIPVGPYSTARIFDLYGSTEAGELIGRAPPADETFKQMTFRAQCNDRGIFSIHHLIDGTYYVVSQLNWVDAYTGENQSVGLMQRVTVTGGEEVGILFSPY